MTARRNSVPEDLQAAGDGDSDRRPRQTVRGRARPRWHWLAAIAIAAGVHGGAFSILGINTSRNETPRAPIRGVDWVGERPEITQNAINDALDLLDPAPLFLPTRWNAATRQSGDGEDHGSGEIFGLEPRILSIPEGSSPPGLVVGPKGLGTVATAIRSFSSPYFSAFAQEDRDHRAMPERLALLEVRSGETGELVMSHEIPRSALGNAAPWAFWEPFEVLLAVEATGVLGPPLVPAPAWRAEAHSDVIDDFFRAYLRYEFRPDLRLPAGYYRVVIGP